MADGSSESAAARPSVAPPHVPRPVVARGDASSALAWQAVALAIAAFVAVAVGLATRNAWLLRAEHTSGDLRTALLSTRAASQHPRIALVVVTEETLDRHAYRTPIDRGMLAGLVRTIDAAGAAAIGLDMLLVRPTEPAKDEALLAALAGVRAPVVIAGADSRVGLPPRAVEHQATVVTRTGRTLGYANLLVGPDGVVRHVPAPAGAPGDPPLGFAQALTAAANPAASAAGGKTTAASAAGGKTTVTSWTPVGEPSRIAWLLAPTDGADLFLTIPAHALVEADGAARRGPLVGRMTGLLAGRIVLIGADLEDIDRHRTPIRSGGDDAMPGVRIHAHVVAQHLDNRFIGQLGEPVLWALLLGFAFVGVNLGRARGFIAYSLYGGTATAAILALDAFTFVALRSVLPFMSLLVALVAGIICGVVVRRLAGASLARTAR